MGFNKRSAGQLATIQIATNSRKALATALPFPAAAALVCSSCKTWKIDALKEKKRAAVFERKLRNTTRRASRATKIQKSSCANLIKAYTGISDFKSCAVAARTALLIGQDELYTIKEDCTMAVEAVCQDAVGAINALH